MLKAMLLVLYGLGVYLSAQPINQFNREAQIQGQQAVDRVRTTETIVARFTRTNTPTARPTSRPGSPTFTPTITLTATP